MHDCVLYHFSGLKERPTQTAAMHLTFSFLSLTLRRRLKSSSWRLATAPFVSTQTCTSKCHINGKTKLLGRTICFDLTKILGRTVSKQYCFCCSCGKVCLSLLGTWEGQQGEQWNPAASTILQVCLHYVTVVSLSTCSQGTIHGCKTWRHVFVLLQVLVSIQSLILVSEPYFNEPGYEIEIGSTKGKKDSANYNASTFHYIMKATGNKGDNSTLKISQIFVFKV